MADESDIAKKWAQQQALFFIKAQENVEGKRYEQLMERFRQEPTPQRLEWVVAALGQIAHMFGMKLEVEQGRPLEEILIEAERFFKDHPPRSSKNPRSSS